MENYAGSSARTSRVEITGNNTAHRWIAILLLSCATLLSSSAYALTAADVSIRIPTNQITNIDLTPSIGDILVEATLTLTVSINPSNGAAQPDANGARSVTYTPTTDYVGEDSFTYTVTDGSTTVSAVVTIIVGTVDLSTQTATTPAGSSVATTIENICAGLAATSTSDLKQRCNEFTSATPEQRGKIVEQLAPEEVAAQATAGNMLATQQLRNVGGRLAALRQGVQGVSVAGLSFVQGGQVLSAAALRQGVLGRSLANMAALNFAQDHPVLSAAAQPGSEVESPLARSSLGIFFSGTVSGGDRSASSNEDGFKHASYGLTAGADYRFSNHAVGGGAVGLAQSAVDFDQNSGSLDVNGLSFTGYGTYYVSSKTYLEAVLAYNAHQFKSTRLFDYLSGSTQVKASAVGKPNSTLVAASVGGGYEALTRGAFTLNFSARMDALNSTLAAYSETGAPGLNLAIQEQNTQASVSSLGAQMSYALSFGWGVVLPQCSLAWNHSFNDNAVLIKGSFVADQTQTTFAFKSDNPDRDYTTVGLGASLIVPGGNTAFVHYETTRGKTYWSDYNVALGVRWELPY